MSHKTGRTPPVWVPLTPAARVPKSPAEIARMRAAAEREGVDPDAIEAMLNEPVEMWKNHRYTVIVNRDRDGHVEHLSLRRNDRKPHIPWRDLQRIKNELAGDEVEAVELFPAESRLVDCANQRHLWVFEPGFRLPLGWDQGRVTAGPERAAEFGAVQS